MTNREFHPGKNGFPFMNDWKLTTLEVSYLRKYLQNGLATVLKKIEEDYPGTVQQFCIKEWMDVWAEIGFAEFYRMQGGMVFTLLDYYYLDRKIPIEKVFKKGMYANELRAYLWQRNKDSFNSTLEKILYTIIVYQFIPKQMEQSENLNQRIKKHLNTLPDVNLESVNVDLKFFKGGEEFLEKTNKEEFEKIIKEIEDGGVCLFNLIDDKMDVFRMKKLLAFGSKQISNSKVVLIVYDINQPKQTLKLLMDWEKREITFNEKTYIGWVFEEYDRDKPPV